MKTMMVLAISAAFAVSTGSMPVQAGGVTGANQTLTQSVEHGGGCRKSSPPGQCCHMDNKAGTVHCH